MEQTRVSTALSLPLTDSRIAFSRLIGGLMFAKNRLAAIDGSTEDELLISPSLGFAHDTRDSPLRPESGGLFFIDGQASRDVSDGSTYYLLRNDISLFRGAASWLVFAANSNLAYQIGEFPEYIRFGMGGAGTLRGYSSGVFEGNHRWIQSFESRITPFSTWIFSVPYAKVVDVTISAVLFVDGGIVWDAEQDFTSSRWHSGFGVGLRIYSPFQDVTRIDVGFNQGGSAVFYFSTGSRF